MADEAAAKWRLRRMNRPKGAYYVLETGRNETRVTMSLGYLREDQAETALQAMQAEEERTVGRVYHRRILLKHKEDPEEAVDILLNERWRDLGTDTIDYGAMSVAKYFDEVFWPVRSNPDTDNGVAPSTAASCTTGRRSRTSGRRCGRTRPRRGSPGT